MAVRPGADAEPLAIAPIDEVVLAALPLPGPVRDLVVAVPGRGERALRSAIEARLALVIGLRRCGLTPPPRDARVIPSARQASRRARSSVAGFASTVASTSARSKDSRIASPRLAISSGSRRLGVPPPT